MTALMPLPRSRARLSPGRVGLVAHHGIRSGSGPAAAEAGNPYCFYDDRETWASHHPVTSSSASAAQTSPRVRISRRPRIMVVWRAVRRAAHRLDVVFFQVDPSAGSAQLSLE